MTRVEMRWPGVRPGRQSANFGLPAVEKRPQIILSGGRKLVDGSTDSSWIGKGIPRSLEVIKEMRHASGEGQSGGHPPGSSEVVKLTENDLKSQPIVAGGPSRAQTQALLVGERFHVPRRCCEDLPSIGLTWGGP